MSKESLSQAIELAGGQVHLARGIRERIAGSKIGQVHVWGWLNSVQMEVPPPETVIPICDFLGWRITPHEIRPDLYPNPTDALPPDAKVGAGETAQDGHDANVIAAMTPAKTLDLSCVAKEGV